MDYSPPTSSVHEILQARILEWVTSLSPGDLPNPGIEPVSLRSPAIAGVFFTTIATWQAPKIESINTSYHSAMKLNYSYL